MLPMTVSAREQGLTTFYVPESNVVKSTLVEELIIILAASLANLVDYLHGYTSIPPFVNRLAEGDQDNSQLSRRLNTASDVDGNGAVDGASTAPWNGSDHAMTHVSSTQLSASISAADIVGVQRMSLYSMALQVEELPTL